MVCADVFWDWVDWSLTIYVSVAVKHSTYTRVRHVKNMGGATPYPRPHGHPGAHRTFDLVPIGPPFDKAATLCDISGAS